MDEVREKLAESNFDLTSGGQKRFERYAVGAGIPYATLHPSSGPPDGQASQTRRFLRSLNSNE
jgi:hypothetical protein